MRVQQTGTLQPLHPRGLPTTHGSRPIKPRATGGISSISASTPALGCGSKANGGNDAMTDALGEVLATERHKSQQQSQSLQSESSESRLPAISKSGSRSSPVRSSS